MTGIAVGVGLAAGAGLAPPPTGPISFVRATPAANGSALNLGTIAAGDQLLRWNARSTVGSAGNPAVPAGHAELFPAFSVEDPGTRRLG